MDTTNRYGESQTKLCFRQCVTAMAGLFGIIVSGTTAGYSAILLPQLRTSNSTSLTDITISTIEEESWIAASAVLPMAPGCWLSGLMMEKLGRRTSFAVIFPAFFAAWLIIGFAQSITTIVIGRFLSGLCVGLLGPLVPVYIGETSEPSLRGILLGGISLAIALGVIVCHAMGTWLHWRLTAFLCATIPIVCWIACLFLRESPSWLLAHGQKDRAKETWIYLRGERSSEEFALLEHSKAEEVKSENVIQEKSLWSTWRATFSSRYFRKPLVVLSLFFFTAQFSGVNVVTFYSVEMLADVSGPENAYLGCLILDAIRVVISVVACFLVRNHGRRMLTFVSGFGTAATLLVLTTCLLFDIGKPWAPALLLFVYTALLGIGLVPLPWMLCGELFPRKFRGLGSGFTSGFTFICFFIVVKTAPAMFEYLRPHWTFAIYGIITFFGTTFLYFSLPETKDKTLQDIERSFDKKPKGRINSEKFIECAKKENISWDSKEREKNNRCDRC